MQLDVRLDLQIIFNSRSGQNRNLICLIFANYSVITSLNTKKFIANFSYQWSLHNYRIDPRIVVVFINRPVRTKLLAIALVLAMQTWVEYPILAMSAVTKSSVRTEPNASGS